MLNILSILIGLVAAVIAFFGLIPFIGIVNWVALPIAFFGAVIGALSSSNGGRNFNLVVFILAALRLSLGGGIL